MSEKKGVLSWDYFLGGYEKDLILMALSDLELKYPNVSREVMESDLKELLGVLGAS